ncbi:MAG: hypothetical protein AAFU71_11720, partial [Cyanobacteria bacterium J06632_22]
MPSKKNNFIRFTEYVAVSTSVVGSVAAILTRQLAYAVAPFSVALALNLLSRRQTEQHMQRQIAQSLNQLSSQTETFSQRQDELQAAQQTLGRSQQEQLEKVQSFFETSSEALQVASNEQIHQIWHQVKLLQSRLDKLNDQQHELNRASRIERLQKNIDEITDHLRVLSNTQWEQRLAEIEQAVLNFDTTATARLAVDYKTLRDDFEAKNARVTQDLDDIRKYLRQSSLTFPSRDLEDQRSDIESHDLKDLLDQAIPRLPTDENFDVDINLGIDFGTGFTKVC